MLAIPLSLSLSPLSIENGPLQNQPGKDDEEGGRSLVNVQACMLSGSPASR